MDFKKFKKNLEKFQDNYYKNKIEKKKRKKSNTPINDKFLLRLYIK